MPPEPKTWPALSLRTNAWSDLAAAAVDDFQPTAVDEDGTDVRVFFAAPALRDAAVARLRADGLPAVPVSIPDDGWAARSQERLPPITVGRITVLSGPDGPAANVPSPAAPIVIRIQPSVGFGTGHHATTRLCLDALQAVDVRGTTVLDVGTGSGILAIAAARLGAASVVGIDSDPDALQAARENVERNPGAAPIVLREAALGDAPLPPARVVIANLTGAQIAREAPALLRAVEPGGTLSVSGVLASEESEVRRAVALPVSRRTQEDEWISLTFSRTDPGEG